MKNIEKSIIRVVDDDWSGILEMLFGLNGDPYGNE
jgi:hypothetical protein